uniref:Golgi SNAP receptor complex member 1 n=1 Tax=Hirondellea gigas TaxID=1518452 RepID=A0A2P2HZW3_9CRUS
MTTTTEIISGDVENFDKMSFEELRKRARKLEGDIDAKLVLFSKLASNYGSSHRSNKSDSIPLLSTDDQYETLCSELEQMLGYLSDINEHLNSCSSSSAVAHLHTIQRHRDILQDYRNEFQRTNGTIKNRREREQLIGTCRSNGSLVGLSRRDLYLKENDHLTSSERMIDEQISIAVDARDHMKSQREAFKMIQTKVNDLSNRFPIINTLMNRIYMRKRRDSLIMGVVFGLGFTFLLWWMLF